MPTVIAGLYYEFHAERVISRAGQPIQTRVGIEIGPQISQEDARRQVLAGKDVYTPKKQDAYTLARRLYATGAVEDPPHDEFYFSHYHPGGVHPRLDHDRPGRRRAIAGPGHVFFGSRGGLD